MVELAEPQVQDLLHGAVNQEALEAVLLEVYRLVELKESESRDKDIQEVVKAFLVTLEEVVVEVVLLLVVEQHQVDLEE